MNLSKVKQAVQTMLKKKQTKPTQVILETTNRCNLNCPFCLVGMQNELQKKHGNTAHELMSREMGTMSMETFDRVRKELKIFGIKKVYLHFQGEPFLNKLTPDFAEQLKSDGMYVGVFTNGQAFTDKMINKIANVEIDLIRFSVDGASEETYGVNRVGGKFSNVLKNMEKVSAAHKGKKTRIEWQFLPLKNNEHEVETARSLAKQISVHFFTKGFRETDPNLTPTNKEYRSKFMKKPCKDIYKQLGFYWNGDVVPCCYDVDGKEVMGNIMNHDLENIWNNSKYNKFRKDVDEYLKQPEKEPDICKTCLRWR
ncbi:MAG: radical SAM protein [Desulfobacterales bacterium]|nr:radical SAM protein [Desulfobacterales bacterium]